MQDCGCSRPNRRNLVDAGVLERATALFLRQLADGAVT
jgi:hypothetical protein